MEHDEDAPLIGVRDSRDEAQPTPFFNNGPRKPQDLKWKWAYLASVALMVAGGIALTFTGSPDFGALTSSEHLADPASCPVGGPGRRRLLSEDDQSTGNLNALSAHPFGALFGSLFGAIVMGYLFLLTVRHHAPVLVKSSITLQVVIPVVMGVVLMVTGNYIGGGVSLAFAAVYAFIFVYWRQQIELVTRLLGITGAALVANPGLIGLALTLPVVLGALLIPAGLAGFFAYTNGQVVPNLARYGAPVADGHGHMVCMDQDGKQIMCCSWQVDGVALAYMVMLGVVVTWTSMLLSALRQFVVAGATAQWYFTPVTRPNDGGWAGPSKPSQRGEGRTKGRVITSLGHALGPSFGSLCAAAALLTIISYIRSAVDSCERSARERGGVAAVVCTIIAFVLRLILSVVEFLTRFTVVRMAMTGEAFVDAGHSMTDVLRRNALDAAGVWWLPPFILNNCALMVSLAFGVLLWGASAMVWRVNDAADNSAGALGLAGGFLAFMVIMFFEGILLNALDAVFVCFVLDRDAARVTREDVHVVLAQVPGMGPVVQQPDGNLAYANPAQV